MIAINKILILGFFALSIATTYAHKVKCSNPNGTTFEEISNCLWEDYWFYDKKLNSIYKKKYLSLSLIHQNELKKSEFEWIKTRDTECQSLVDENNYGKESHFSAVECMTDMTIERIDFLEKYK